MEEMLVIQGSVSFRLTINEIWKIDFSANLSLNYRIKFELNKAKL